MRVKDLATRGLLGLALIGAPACGAATTGDEGNGPAPQEDTFYGEDAYGSEDLIVDPYEEDVFESGYDAESGEDLVDPYQEDTTPSKEDTYVAPGDELIARACRDENRQGDGTCNALEFKANQTYVFNFAKKDPSQYLNSVDSAAGENPVNGHPTESEGLINKYCVRWTAEDSPECSEGDSNFYHFFKPGTKNVIEVMVIGENGKTDKDFVEYEAN